ncbi:MAG TPA: NAD(P)/FAD-dependent oxidoreductase, partial [Firmicutes bacterium]|nr:NAD(P)/FAD-dependent oxidoreductase [Bacillota bacterium]
IGPGSWDDIKERYADRVIRILDRYAPGLAKSIIGRCVLSPVDLERMNPNLVRGDIGAGSAHLDQTYVLRPLPGWSRCMTPIRRLFITGAATHPGAGVSGNSGYTVANILLR